jgi:rRNA processing protein Gar1
MSKDVNNIHGHRGVKKICIGDSVVHHASGYVGTVLSIMGDDAYYVVSNTDKCNKIFECSGVGIDLRRHRREFINNIFDEGL